MEFLRNKHVIIAMLVAPVLAVISYFAVDRMVGEVPHAAKAGNSYQLVEKSNCRYQSGRCDLKNGEFNLRLTATHLDNGSVELFLQSEHPLKGVIQALVDAQGKELPPFNMQPADEQGTLWSSQLLVSDASKERVYLAVAANDSLYYADASLTFIDRENILQAD